MKRTTVMLPDDVDSRLRHEASRRGVSIAEVVRAVLEEHLPAPVEGGRLGFFGVGRGSPADVSERVDAFVGAAVARRATSKPV